MIFNSFYDIENKLEYGISYVDGYIYYYDREQSRYVHIYFDDNLDLIVDIIKVQTENNRIIDYTIEQLQIIFGLNENEDDENSGSSDNKPTVNPVEPPKLNPGELQGGYAANFIKSTSYDGENGSAYLYEAKVNDKNYAFKRYLGNWCV